MPYKKPNTQPYEILLPKCFYCNNELQKIALVPEPGYNEKFFLWTSYCIETGQLRLFYKSTGDFSKTIGSGFENKPWFDMFKPLGNDSFEDTQVIIAQCLLKHANDNCLLELKQLERACISLAFSQLSIRCVFDGIEKAIKEIGL